VKPAPHEEGATYALPAQSLTEDRALSCLSALRGLSHHKRTPSVFVFEYQPAAFRSGATGRVR
jgi:hypothetical protein